MKKLIIILMILPLLARSQNKTENNAAAYSSNFAISDPVYCSKVLTLWRYYEHNRLDQSNDLIADTVTMVMSNGEVIKGRENGLAAITAYRKSLKDIKVTVDAYISLKSIDKNENWVTIWGVDDFTDNKGKHDKTHIHEIWRFNKDGKVDFMREYVGK